MGHASSDRCSSLSVVLFLAAAFVVAVAQSASDLKADGNESDHIVLLQVTADFKRATALPFTVGASPLQQTAAVPHFAVRAAPVNPPATGGGVLDPRLFAPASSASLLLPVASTPASMASVHSADVPELPEMPETGEPKASALYLEARSDIPSQRGIILRYMQGRNLAVCACAKCGSTSLWDWLFQGEFGHSFLEDQDGGLDGIVQDVEGTAWHKRFTVLRERDAQDTTMKSAYSFALIRDPKERLVSAWKSKVACGDSSGSALIKFGTDIGVRSAITKSLLELWGRNNDEKVPPCLSFVRFLSILTDIHKDGHEYLLNGHFMPQHLACFSHASPMTWSKVSDIAESQPFATLAQHLGMAHPVNTTIHSSKTKILVSQAEAAMLDLVTSGEYAALGPYLSRPSKVIANQYVLSDGFPLNGGDEHI